MWAWRAWAQLGGDLGGLNTPDTLTVNGFPMCLRFLNHYSPPRN